MAFLPYIAWQEKQEAITTRMEVPLRTGDRHAAGLPVVLGKPGFAAPVAGAHAGAHNPPGFEG